VTSLAGSSFRPSARDERYAAIADHGVIGDLQTAALVALDGAIDFLCVPEFDSPSVFARLLDAECGGYFAISPAVGSARGEQRYIRDTNVLVTRFASAAMDVEVVDFMPVERRPAPSRIVRLVRAVRGGGTMRAVCVPRVDYGRETPAIELADGTATFTGSGGVRLRLTSNVPLEHVVGGVGAEFNLEAGRQAVFALEQVDRERGR
jgi:GH15 family glucan-1,4-alpha-glucosidase